MTTWRCEIRKIGCSIPIQPVVGRRLGFGRGSDIGVAELMACYRAYTNAVRTVLTAL
jgi:hypothetical protein